MDQNEIEALINGDSDDEGSGELSQADIDAAMAGNAATPEPSSTPEPSGEAAPGASFGEGESEGFSQADIDALMGGGGGSADSSAPPTANDAVSDQPQLDSEGRPLDEMGAAMAAAIAEEQAAAAEAGNASTQAADLPLEEIVLPAFDEEEVYTESTQPLSLLHDVQLHVKIELGRTRMLVEDVLHLGEGSVVELDRLAGDPVDVFVNERLVARGEVLVLNDNFCVRVSEIISGTQNRAAG